jgi:hypothetical protein
MNLLRRVRARVGIMGGGYVRNSGRPSPSYSFSHLVPVRHWARDPALRSWPVLLLVAWSACRPSRWSCSTTRPRPRSATSPGSSRSTSPWPGCCCSASSSARSTSAGPCWPPSRSSASSPRRPPRSSSRPSCTQHEQPARHLHHRPPRGTGQGHPDRGGGVDLAATGTPRRRGTTCSSAR